MTKLQTEQKIEDAISDILYHTIYAAIRPEQMYTVDKLAKVLTASNRELLDKVEDILNNNVVAVHDRKQWTFNAKIWAELRKLES